jgi:hypothetical protein
MPIAQSETGQSLIVPRDEAEIAQLQTGQLVASTSKVRPFRLSWTHYVFLLGVKNPDERSFYEIESADQNWNLRELRRQFDSGLYERLALSRDKKGVRRLAREGQIVSQPQDLLKEPLVLEFLGLSPLTREQRAAQARVEISTHFNARQQAFLDFVLSHYVAVGVEELDQDKLTPLLNLRYDHSLADAVADPDKPEEIASVFVTFQKYLYQ